MTVSFILTVGGVLNQRITTSTFYKLYLTRPKYAVDGGEAAVRWQFCTLKRCSLQGYLEISQHKTIPSNTLTVNDLTDSDECNGEIYLEIDLDS